MAAGIILRSRLSTQRRFAHLSISPQWRRHGRVQSRLGRRVLPGVPVGASAETRVRSLVPTVAMAFVGFVMPLQMGSPFLCEPIEQLRPHECSRSQSKSTAARRLR